MRIQHNISAMNANRNLRKNTGSLSKNLEKLSSGYRINRSADDAAGLSISERMRASISGLNQAENNVGDGISLVQTADGAMQEIHEILTRLTTLAAEAANGTLTNEERDAIQEEVDHLLDEIVRIRSSTNFNNIPLLQGDSATSTTSAKVLGDLPAWVTIDAGSGGTLGTTHTTQETANVTERTTNADGTTTTTVVDTPTVYVNHAAAKLDFSALNASNVGDLVAKDDMGFYTTCCTCDNHYSIKFNMDGNNGRTTSGSHYIYNVDITGVTSGSDLIDKILAVTGSQPESHYTTMVKDGNTLVIFDERPSDTSHMAGLSSGQGMTFDNFSNSVTNPHVSSGYGLFGKGVAYDKSVNILGDIILQIGEHNNASDQLEVDLPDMDLAKIGINALSVTTIANAQSAMEKIRKGIDYVSGERGRMGAYQNRLEHTRNSLGTSIENLTSSESVIRDTDVAEEMMKYTKENILIQSAQAMLAQSNAVPQGVLQLMQ